MYKTVFLHGFLGNTQDWEEVCKFFPSHSYLCVDLPGHGNTPFTEDFFSLMPKLPKMHLVGYSMGGRLAMQYAHAFPEKIASFTLLSAHRGLQTKEERENRIASDLALSQKLLHSFDDFLLEWYDQPIFGGFRPNLETRKKQNPKDLASSMNYFSLGKQPLFRLEGAMILVGEKDHKYRELYPDAIVVPGAGHMVHLENPKFVAKTILRKVHS